MYLLNVGERDPGSSSSGPYRTRLQAAYLMEGDGGPFSAWSTI